MHVGTFMGVGREVGGARPHRILKISAKKVVFLIVSGKKQISLLLAPPRKKNPLLAPLGKSPSNAHGYIALSFMSRNL